MAHKKKRFCVSPPGVCGMHISLARPGSLLVSLFIFQPFSPSACNSSGCFGPSGSRRCNAKLCRFSAASLVPGLGLPVLKGHPRRYPFQRPACCAAQMHQPPFSISASLEAIREAISLIVWIVIYGAQGKSFSPLAARRAWWISAVI